jgi:hypothetical protein
MKIKQKINIIYIKINTFLFGRKLNSKYIDRTPKIGYNDIIPKRRDENV